MLYVSASAAGDHVKPIWPLLGVAVTLTGVGGAVICGVAATSLDSGLSPNWFTDVTS